MRRRQPTAGIRQGGANGRHRAPTEAVGLMGDLALGDTASIHGAFPMKVGRRCVEGRKCGEMERKWGEGRKRGEVWRKWGEGRKWGEVGRKWGEDHSCQLQCLELAPALEIRENHSRGPRPDLFPRPP